MSEEKTTQENSEVVEAPATETPKTEAPATESKPAESEGTKEATSDAAAASTDAKDGDSKGAPRGRGGDRKPFQRGGGFRKGGRGGRGGFRDRPKPEFDQKIINISRVTRVVKGGRRLSFRVDMVIGDKKGRIGLGSGKATDTSLAIQKANNQARKNLVYLNLTKNNSIPFETKAKVTSSSITMMPNKQRGLVAGSTVRNVLELAGITDVTTRVLSRSKNKLNNAKAAIKALTAFEMNDEERAKKQAAAKAAREKEVGSSRKPQGRFTRKPRVTRK